MGAIVPQVITEDRAGGALVIDGGLRFDGSKSQYLSRTIGAGSISWTYSGWVKRNRLSVEDSANDNINYNGTLLSNSGATSLLAFYKNAGGAQNSIWLYDPNGTSKMTASKHRDVSSWYHIVANYNGSVANLYVNGTQINNFLGSDNTNGSGASGFSTNGATFYIGRISTAYSYFQLAQVYFIDGQALDPSYFGYTDPLTNTWRPKKYTGTFTGTNTFYLPFDGNSPIGQDLSGNNNNWTPVNFGGSNTLEKATGALPILNTDGGGKVARVGVRTDSNASSLVLALPLVGIKSDFSNAINGGTSNKAVTDSNITYSSSYGNFYSASGSFNGSSSYLNTSGLSINASTFTVEFWINFNAFNSLPVMTSTSSRGGIAFYFSNSSTLNFLGGTASGSWNVNTNITVALTTGTWYHFACVRSAGGTFDIYKDGILLSSVTSGSITHGELSLGRQGGDNNLYFNGYIQDFRAYSGLAKYTSNFIPASTDPDIVPDSPSGVSYSSNLTQITDGAVAFGANTDYLNIGSSNDYSLSGDFTVELYINASFPYTSPYYPSPITFNKGGTETQLYYNTASSFISWYYNGGDVVTASLPGGWNHIAVTRSGSTVYMFVNGILRSSATNANTFGGSASYPSYVGVYNPSNGSALGGFISNLHVVKGTALYTSNFTPPSAPISSVANTKLLCCKSNSSATAADVTPGTITANGNATASNFNPFTVNINTQRGKQSGWCTLNPLANPDGTLSNGNLTWSSTTTQDSACASTIYVNSGKWYWEVIDDTGTGALNVGISKDTDNLSPTPGTTSGGYYYLAIAYKYNNNSISAYGSTWTTKDTISVALDMDAGTVTFYKNGISQGVAYSGLSGYFSPSIGDGGQSTAAQGTINFGQKPFKFPPPAGFQPLTLANTPRPTIVRPDQYVGVTTYTGNGAARSINVGFKPDFVWIKRRTVSSNHCLFDTVRGATKRLITDGTDAEVTVAQALTSFNSNGFSVGTDSDTNGDTYPIVSWAWKAGGNSSTFNINDVGYATASAAGLTAGTITPTGASVGTKQGFSIITYTGNNVNDSTISHGLTKTPSFIIVKSRGYTDYWMVDHPALDSNKNLVLNLADAQTAWGSGVVKGTSSTVFTLKTNSSGSNENCNRSGYNYVAYLWAEIPGFSKFGSYTGNGSSDGPVVITGFRPRWIMFKCSSTNNGYTFWDINDSTRSEYNSLSRTLCANLSDAEDSANIGTPNIDILSNGFKIRTTGSAKNLSNQTYIYAAFAESPSFNLYGAQANAR